MMLASKYPTCWTLQYQQDDRFRHEQVPEILRIEKERYNRMVECGRWGAQWQMTDE